MFQKYDDRLQRLNEELLAEDEEYYEEDCEASEYEELSEYDLEELLDEAEEEIPDSREPVQTVRNYANQYGKGRPKTFDADYFDEEEDLEDEEFLYRDDYRNARKHRKKKKAEKASRNGKKGGIGLVILAILELIAIGGIIAWWVSWVV